MMSSFIFYMEVTEYLKYHYASLMIIDKLKYLYFLRSVFSFIDYHCVKIDTQMDTDAFDLQGIEWNKLFYIYNSHFII